MKAVGFLKSLPIEAEDSLFDCDLPTPDLRDADLLVRSLRELDLSHLERVSFKGGEPMVNTDVPAVLEHLREIGRLAPPDWQ